MEKKNLISLVERAAKGEAAAIEALYKATYSGAYSLANHLCANPNDVDDILQESYIAAFSGLHTIKEKAAFPAWLKKIIVNTWRAYAKDKSNLYETAVYDAGDEYLDGQGYSESALDAVELSETGREIFGLVNELPEHQRVCMILFYYEDMKIDEIAEALNIPEGSVKSRLYYGRQQLRRMMEARGFDTFGVPRLSAVAKVSDSALLARVLAALGAGSGQAAAGGGALKIGAAVAALIAAGGIIGGATVMTYGGIHRTQPTQTTGTYATTAATAATTTTTTATTTTTTTAETTVTTTAHPTEPRIFATFDYSEGEDGIVLTRYTGNESDVVIPDTIDGKNVAAIGDGAFKGSGVLRSVVIPATVKRIGGSAFKDCRQLRAVSIGGGVKEIGGSAFLGCVSLNRVTIPANVRTVGGLAFAYCTGLEEAEAAQGVEIIGYSAFRDCSALQRAILPASVISIGDDTFDGASAGFYITAPEDSYAYQYAEQKGFL